MLLDGAKFICMDKEGKPCQTIIAKGRNFTIGCLVDCDCVLEQAEKIHCRIDCDAFGHVTIYNKSEKNPISVNGETITIKRTLFDNAKIKILDRDYVWQYPKISTNVDVSTDSMSTPNKQIGIPVQPPNSCPTLKYHRNQSNRFTVHNLRSYRVDSDESNCLDESTEPVQSKTTTSVGTGLESTIPIATAQLLDVTPAKVDLVDSTPDKKTSSTEKRLKTFRNVWGWSGMTTTSYSPREAGVRIEKTFTALIPPTTPNSSSCRTPRGLLERLGVDKQDNANADLMVFSTPSKQSENNPKNSQGVLVQHKKSAMKIVDLTIPSKLRPESPFQKSVSTKKPSAVKSLGSFSEKATVGTANRKGITTPLLSTPKTTEANVETPVSTSSAITVDSSSAASDISEASAVTSTTPSRPKTTQANTPGSALRKQVLLASAKKQQQTAASSIHSPATTPVSTKLKIGATTTQKKCTTDSKLSTKKLPAVRKLHVADKSLNKSPMPQNSNFSSTKHAGDASNMIEYSTADAECTKVASNMLTTSTPYKAVLGSDKPDSSQMQDTTECYSAMHEDSEVEGTSAAISKRATEGDELLQEIEEILNTSDELKRQIQATAEANDVENDETSDVGVMVVTISPPPASIDLIEPIISTNAELQKSPKSNVIASVLLKAIDNAEKQKVLSPKEDDEKENKINKSLATPTVSAARRRISLSTPVTVAAPAVALVAEESSSVICTPLTPKRVTKRRPSIDEVPLGNVTHNRTIDLFNTENMGAIIEEEPANETSAVGTDKTDANLMHREYLTLDASELTTSVAVTESACQVKDYILSEKNAEIDDEVVISPLQCLDESFAEPCNSERKIETQETYSESTSNKTKVPEKNAVDANKQHPAVLSENIEKPISTDDPKEATLQLDESFGEVEYLDDSELMKEIDDQPEEPTNLTFEIEASKTTIQTVEQELSPKEVSIIEILSDDDEDKAQMQNKSAAEISTDAIDQAQSTKHLIKLPDVMETAKSIIAGNLKAVEVCQVELKTLEMPDLSVKPNETVDVTLNESLEAVTTETNKTIEVKISFEQTTSSELKEKILNESEILEKSTNLVTETSNFDVGEQSKTNEDESSFEVTMEEQYLESDEEVASTTETAGNVNSSKLCNEQVEKVSNIAESYVLEASNVAEEKPDESLLTKTSEDETHQNEAGQLESSASTEQVSAFENENGTLTVTEKVCEELLRNDQQTSLKVDEVSTVEVTQKITIDQQQSMEVIETNKTEGNVKVPDISIADSAAILEAMEVTHKLTEAQPKGTTKINKTLDDEAEKSDLTEAETLANDTVLANLKVTQMFAEAQPNTSSEIKKTFVDEGEHSDLTEGETLANDTVLASLEVTQILTEEQPKATTKIDKTLVEEAEKSDLIEAGTLANDTVLASLEVTQILTEEQPKATTKIDKTLVKEGENADLIEAETLANDTVLANLEVTQVLGEKQPKSTSEINKTLVDEGDNSDLIEAGALANDTVLADLNVTQILTEEQPKATTKINKTLVDEGEKSGLVEADTMANDTVLANLEVTQILTDEKPKSSEVIKTVFEKIETSNMNETSTAANKTQMEVTQMFTVEHTKSSKINKSLVEKEENSNLMESSIITSESFSANMEVTQLHVGEQHLTNEASKIAANNVAIDLENGNESIKGHEVHISMPLAPEETVAQSSSLNKVQVENIGQTIENEQIVEDAFLNTTFDEDVKIQLDETTVNSPASDEKTLSETENEQHKFTQQQQNVEVIEAGAPEESKQPEADTLKKDNRNESSSSSNDIEKDNLHNEEKTTEEAIIELDSSKQRPNLESRLSTDLFDSDVSIITTVDEKDESVQGETLTETNELNQVSEPIEENKNVIVEPLEEQQATAAKKTNDETEVLNIESKLISTDEAENELIDESDISEEEVIERAESKTTTEEINAGSVATSENNATLEKESIDEIPPIILEHTTELEEDKSSEAACSNVPNQERPKEASAETLEEPVKDLTCSKELNKSADLATKSMTVEEIVVDNAKDTKLTLNSNEQEDKEGTVETENKTTEASESVPAESLKESEKSIVSKMIENDESTKLVHAEGTTLETSLSKEPKMLEAIAEEEAKECFVKEIPGESFVEANLECNEPKHKAENKNLEETKSINSGEQEELSEPPAEVTSESILIEEPLLIESSDEDEHDSSLANIAKSAAHEVTDVDESVGKEKPTKQATDRALVSLVPEEIVVIESSEDGNSNELLAENITVNLALDENKKIESNEQEEPQEQVGKDVMEIRVESKEIGSTEQEQSEESLPEDMTHGTVSERLKEEESDELVAEDIVEKSVPEDTAEKIKSKEQEQSLAGAITSRIVPEETIEIESNESDEPKEQAANDISENLMSEESEASVTGKQDETGESPVECEIESGELNKQEEQIAEAVTENLVPEESEVVEPSKKDELDESPNEPLESIEQEEAKEPHEENISDDVEKPLQEVSQDTEDTNVPEVKGKEQKKIETLESVEKETVKEPLTESIADNAVLTEAKTSNKEEPMKSFVPEETKLVELQGVEAREVRKINSKQPKVSKSKHSSKTKSDKQELEEIQSTETNKVIEEDSDAHEKEKQVEEVEAPGSLSSSLEPQNKTSEIEAETPARNQRGGLRRRGAVAPKYDETSDTEGDGRKHIRKRRSGQKSSPKKQDTEAKTPADVSDKEAKTTTAKRTRKKKLELDEQTNEQEVVSATPVTVPKKRVRKNTNQDVQTEELASALVDKDVHTQNTEEVVVETKTTSRRRVAKPKGQPEEEHIDSSLEEVIPTKKQRRGRVAQKAEPISEHYEDAEMPEATNLLEANESSKVVAKTAKKTPPRRARTPKTQAVTITEHEDDVQNEELITQPETTQRKTAARKPRAGKKTANNEPTIEAEHEPETEQQNKTPAPIPVKRSRRLNSQLEKPHELAVNQEPLEKLASIDDESSTSKHATDEGSSTYVDEENVVSDEEDRAIKPTKPRGGTRRGQKREAAKEDIQTYAEAAEIGVEATSVADVKTKTARGGRGRGRGKKNDTEITDTRESTDEAHEDNLKPATKARAAGGARGVKKQIEKSEMTAESKEAASVDEEETATMETKTKARSRARTKKHAEVAESEEDAAFEVTKPTTKARAASGGRRVAAKRQDNKTETIPEEEPLDHEEVAQATADEGKKTKGRAVGRRAKPPVELMETASAAAVLDDDDNIKHNDDDDDNIPSEITASTTEVKKPIRKRAAAATLKKQKLETEALPQTTEEQVAETSTKKAARGRRAPKQLQQQVDAVQIENASEPTSTTTKSAQNRSKHVHFNEDPNTVAEIGTEAAMKASENEAFSATTAPKRRRRNL